MESKLKVTKVELRSFWRRMRKGFTNYVKYDIISPLTVYADDRKEKNTMWNRKNEANYLGQILLEQEADSKKKRRDKNATQSSKWNLVLPQNYERILQRFWGTSEFGELLEALTREQRKRMYESISDAMLEKVFCEVPDVVQERIAECSYERLERFFNEASISQAYPVFMLADFDLQCLVVTDMLSQESLMAYARYGSANEDKESFLRVIEKIYVEGRIIQRKYFIRKLALMPAEWIAKLLEKYNSELACAILEEMEAEHKHETFQAIRKEALYAVLRRCNFLLIDKTKSFPISRLTDEERRSVFEILRQEWKPSEIRQFFCTEDFIESFYPIVSLADKEYLLYEVFLANELPIVYQRLQISERREMILLMIGEKGTTQYDYVILEEAIEVLEQFASDGLDYYEQLTLEDLRERVLKVSE